MVYVFGMNFPLVETLFILGFFVFLSTIFIIWSLISLRKLNIKLDELIKEERIVKHELRLALKEESSHLFLLSRLITHVKTIKNISDQKVQKIREAELNINKASLASNKGTPLSKAMHQLHDVDKLSRKEDNILQKIGNDIKKYAQKGASLPKGVMDSFKKLFSK
jgi:hypothetical protein